MWDVGDDEPSVMIIAINVQHLLSLDTEDTATRLDVDIAHIEECRYVPRKHAFSQSCSTATLA